MIGNLKVKIDAINLAIEDETLVVSCDFDGCLDHVEMRKKVAIYLINLVEKNPKIRHLIVVIGSLRQSVFLDVLSSETYYSWNGGQYVSCSLLGREFIVLLQNLFHEAFADAAPHISFHPLLTHDIYNDLPAGTIFSHMNPELYSSCASKSYEEPRSLIQFDVIGPIVTFCTWDKGKISDSRGTRVINYPDRSKTIMMFMFMHEIALLLGKNKTYTLIHLDDNIEVLNSLDWFWMKNKGLMPFTGRFKAVICDSYVSELNDRAYTQTQGCGSINAHYRHVMKQVFWQVPDDSRVDDVHKALVHFNRQSTAICYHNICTIQHPLGKHEPQILRDIAHYEAELSRGITKARFNLSDIYFSLNDTGKMRRYLNDNDVDSMLMLALDYRDGKNNLAIDYAQALYLLQIAIYCVATEDVWFISRMIENMKFCNDALQMTQRDKSPTSIVGFNSADDVVREDSSCSSIHSTKLYRFPFKEPTIEQSDLKYRTKVLSTFPEAETAGIPSCRR